MNGPRISRVSLSWVHRFHSLSGIHGPTHFSLVHRFHIGNSSIYYLVVVAVGSLVLILVKFQEVMPSLVFPSRGGRIGVQHTIKLSDPHFPRKFPSFILRSLAGDFLTILRFHHTPSIGRQEINDWPTSPIHRLCHRFSLCSVSSIL